MRPSGKIRGRRTLPGFLLRLGKGRKALSGERAFLPPPNLLPPSPKTFGRWGGRHPGRGHGNQAYATRRLSAKIDPAPTCFYSIKTTGYLSSKNALGNRNTSENLSTLSRDTFLCQRTQRNNFIQQAHPHTGKLQQAILPLPNLHLPYSTTTPNFASTDTGMAKRAVLRGRRSGKYGHGRRGS